MLESYPKASPSLGLRICPSFPSSTGRARDPPSQRAAPAQSRAGGGEGPFQVHSRGSRATARPPARPQRGHAPLRGRHNFSPEVGLLRLSSALGPTSRNLPLPARPGSPPTASGKPEGPTSARRPAAAAPAPGQTRPPAPARAPLRPNSPPPKGPGARSRRVWFELGSAGGALWPRSLHPLGSPAGGLATVAPRVTGWEPVTPSATAGWRAPTHVEPFYIIERGAPAQAPFRGAPQPPARSGGTRPAPTDGGGNWGRSPGFGVHHRRASAGR